MFEDDQIETHGHKFGLPELPIQSTANMKHRYDPIIVQVTNLLMQDGKLSVAQRVRRHFLCCFELYSRRDTRSDATLTKCISRTWQ